MPSIFFGVDFCLWALSGSQITVQHHPSGIIWYGKPQLCSLQWFITTLCTVMGVHGGDKWIGGWVGEGGGGDGGVSCQLDLMCVLWDEDKQSVSPEQLSILILQTGMLLTLGLCDQSGWDPKYLKYYSLVVGQSAPNLLKWNVPRG